MEIKQFIKKLEQSNFFLVAENGKLILKGKKKRQAHEDKKHFEVDPEIVDYIKKHRDELLEYISKLGANAPKAGSENITSVYRLSGLQQGLLFHSLYDKSGGAYIEQLSCEITRLDEAVFMAAWQHLLERHSIIRSGFFADAFSVPVQCVYNKVQLPVERLDYRLLTAEEQQQQLSAYLSNDRARGFNFRQAPLMRLALIRLSDTRYYLLWTSHHLILDGWSTAVLMDEFLQTYELLINGGALPPLAEDRYEDYIRYIGAIDKQAAEDYWRAYLAGIEEPTLLPFVKDGINRTKGVGVYRQELLTLDRDETAAIEQFCRQHRITVNTLMQGVWSYLLYRYTGNASVTFGVTVSGRPEDLPGMEQRVGVYTNTLPAHIRITEEAALITWLQSIQHEQLQSRRYQYNSLSELQGWSELGAELFDTMLTFQNYPVSEVIGSRNWALEVEAFSIHEQTSNYPLSLRIMSGKQIMVQFIYKEASIDNYYIKRITTHFECVLNQLLNHTPVHISELQLLPAAGHKELLYGFNDTHVDHGSATSILELFAAHRGQQPEAIALMYEDDILTYQQLDERSSQLAHYLIAKGVVAETLVPLCVKRGTAMIVSMLAILKAGGAYVPLDPAYPPERLRYMLEDTGALLVLTDTNNRNNEGLCAMHMIVDLDDQQDVIKNYPSTAPEVSIAPGQLAYVIFTSGSTGRPKGVLIEHKGLLNMVQSHKNILSVKPGARILQFASISFDGSCQEIFNALCNGASLVIASAEEILSPRKLERLLKQRAVDIATLPPSYQAVMTGQWQGLQLVYSAGETLQASVGRSIIDSGVRLINGYGPTENTVTVTLSEAPLRPDGSVTIGGPISNVQVYIVDSKLRLQPVGVAGELLVGGTQVARGYLNRPELTAEKFIPNPFGKGRLYRTGDLARWMPDGQLEYIGRIDDQVKLRGYRIELGEVERVLQQAPGVEQAVVVLASATPQRLVGYIVKEPACDKAAVQAYLNSRLPDYMVPQVLEELESLPVTVNGKVDRRLLSMLSEKTKAVKEQAGPRNELETVLVRIWSELLELPTVGINDNFFELGGHSLLAIRMISALRRELDMELDIREIFDHPVISELAAILAGGPTTANGSLPAIAAYDRHQPIPLSYSQEQLWFVDRLQGSREYHMPYVFRLRGHLDITCFEHALRDIVQRHEILRTVIKEKDGQGYQYIRDSSDWNLHYITQANVDIHSLINQNIDLSADWMLKVWVIKESPDTHLLVALLHHIAFDGWSMSILIKELSALYRARLSGQPVALPAPAIQYADYAIWQRRYLSAQQMAEKIGYWKKQLSALSPLRLPANYPRPVHQSIRGATVVRMGDELLLRSLEALSRAEGVTLFMTLLGVFKVLLYRYTGQEDLYVGAPVAGRHQHEVEGLIGFFVNTLVLRTEVRSSDRFRDVLLRVKGTTLEAYAHQEVPFEKVVAALGQERDLSRHPLFDVKFQLENMPEPGDLDLGGLRLEGHESLSVKAQMDLSLDVRQMPNGLRLSLTYCSDLYREQTATQLLNHYLNLLHAVVQQPDANIEQVPMLGQQEQHRLLHAFNDTATAIEPATIIDLFAKQAALNPDAIAVVYENQSLSYRQLDERSNQLAHYLRHKGVKEETLVPICIDRSLNMIIGLLGILKAGGAYVPVDPAYPTGRITYLLSDTAATIAVSIQACEDRFEHTGIQTLVCLDSHSAQIEACAPTPPSTKLKPGNLSYVIYTSGSTGRPKGVMVEHQGVVNLVHSQTEPLGLRQGINVLQFATISFDASCYEIFCTLLQGGRLFLITKETLLNTGLLRDVIRKNEIELITLPPSYQQAIKEETFNLKTIVSAGEALDKNTATRLIEKGIKVINAYGPTENTVCATLSENPLKDNGVITIGRPLHNVQVYIVDKALNLLPEGVMGELCIAGVQVARGYLNREELTKERFIPNPFGEGRLYRTGDLARWLPDGTIEYLGRIDDQVKIRGYRIELGEVDTALQQLKEVAGCCVVAKPDAAGGHKLVGYYVPVAAALKSREQQLYEKQVAGWQELYEAEYSQPPTAGSAGDPTFDITGWNDSFTGKAIAPQQMREWVADMVQVILSQQPNRILEIGCGTGLLYYPLRAHIKRYIGTDLSAASVNRIKNHITKEQNNYCATLLQVCAAHEIRLQPHEQIDTVVLNSVVQYFPAAEYLTAVIAKSISLLPGTGRIVIGDVRDLRLQRMFQSRLVIDRLQEGAALQEFNWQVHQALAKEEELCLAPSYFYGLQQQFPAISAVEMRWKEVDFENELSLYRYTVILHVGTPPPQLQLQWQPVNTTAQVLAQLDAGVNMIALQDVPNPRLHAEMALSAALDDKRSTIVGDLSFSIRQENDDCSAVEAIMRYAVSKGYHCRRLLAPDALKMHLVISAEKCDALIALPYEPVTANEPVANLPLYTESCMLLQKDLRLQLEQRLPEYMIPTELIALQHLPLTLNGKADRKFLSSREEVKATNTLHYEAPATDLEQRLAAIWQELLGVAKVGLHDNFFELGGHSLLATRVVSAIRKRLHMEVSVRTLFLYPNIKALSVQMMKAEQISLLPSIRVQPTKNKLPLSFSQERLWFIDKLKGSTQYHMPWAFRLHGHLDLVALEEAFRLVITRHEALRTIIREEEGKGYQYLRDADAWQLHCIAFEDLAALGINLQEYIAGLLATPFDLAADFMLKVYLVRLSANEHILAAVAHHIAFDGWSLSILVAELTEIYGSRIANRQPSLKALPVQYADYACWQRDYLTPERMLQKLDHWKQQLQGLEPVALVTDYARPAEQSIRGAQVNRVIGAELTTRLKALSQAHGATLFMTMLAAFKILLFRYTGQSSIHVGTPVAGRQQQELEGLIGFFVNMLVLRSELSAGKNFTEVLSQVKQTTLDAYEHQEVPFEKIVEALGIQRDMSRHPLFDISFQLQNAPPPGTLDMNDVRLISDSAAAADITTQFDIGLDITESGGELFLRLVYCSDLYTLSTIAHLLDHYEQLLGAIVNEPTKDIALLAMLPPDEVNKICTQFNDNSWHEHAQENIIALFARQVRERPDAVAIVYAGDTLTYKQLDQRSNQLAHFLLTKGLTTAMPVGVCLHKSMEMMIAILGILKAGGAYVPLDPAYPPERLAYMVKDAGAALVITASEHIQLFDSAAAHIICVNEQAANIDTCSAAAVNLTIQPGQPAYIMFTSGSTGVPKGVCVTHHNVTSLVHEGHYVQHGCEDALLSTGAVGFDATTFEYWGMLLNGGRLVLCSTDVLLDVPLLKALIAQQYITIMWFTAGWFNELVETDSTLFAPLKTVVAGGDKLSVYHIAQLAAAYPHLQIVNGYGPTENTTFSLSYRVNQPALFQQKEIPIGRPLRGRSAYILDERLQLCGIGVAGELYVGGVGLSLGYVNNEALTTEKFIANPFGKGKLYRTGDLGRWDAEGNVEFLGRRDEQVKIRGYRIEPGEVERVLQGGPGVKGAVVLCMEAGAAGRRLTGYVVADENYDQTALERYLQGKLPEYMLPSQLVQLESIPLTGNGKVDRAALAGLSLPAVQESAYAGARNPLEEALLLIWQELLGVEKIGIYDNFFELGGHSLLVMRALSVIRKEMDIEMSVKTFFQLGTIDAVAKYIRVNRSNGSAEPAHYKAIRL